MKTDRKTFHLKTAAEARRLDEFLAEFQRRNGSQPTGHIPLATVYEFLRRHREGGRIVAHFTEIQLQLALLNCDLSEVGRIVNAERHAGVPADKDPLADVESFCEKTALFRANSDFIFRYRAIWDKVMGLLILLRAPEHFDRFAHANSRKRSFTKVAKETGRIPQPLVAHVVESIEAFDNRYRTGEAHGAGSSRLWSYLYLQDEDSSPQEEMFWAWNSLNSVIAALGEALHKMEQAARSGSAGSSEGKTP